MIHLHVHDAKGSLLDSTNRPHELAKRAKELGQTAIAITNHGFTTSVVEFYKACKKEGVKPILGCEFYITEDMKVQDHTSRYDHLIVLAKNQVGYENLQHLVTLGFTEGYYYKPRIDFKALSSYKEGLVITTACLGATIPKMILDDKPDEEIISVIELYKETFDDFFLEIQAADNPEQMKVNKKLVELSNVCDVPLVATTDVHFLKKEDFNLHGIFIQINQDRENEVYKDCWLKTEEEVFDVLFKHVDVMDAMEAVENTYKIAEMCNVDIELGKSYLPDFKYPIGFNNEVDYFKQLIYNGFRVRGITKLPWEEQEIYMKRVKEEFDVITAKNFTGYFLIVADFLRECRERNIYTGDGRGSADNSLICYLLEITNVDSIKFDLSFSRFLTMDRKALPDIDMDIQSSKKAEAVKILREKYGYDNVAQICTFGSLQAKAVVDAVGKVLGISYKETTEIKKHIPDIEIDKDDTDQSVLSHALKKSSALKEYQEKYPQLFEYCYRLEGLPRSISVHAGGVVICPSCHPMSKFTSLALSKKKEIITQLDMDDVEAVGMVKMDVLGINTLDVIADTLNFVYGES